MNKQKQLSILCVHQGNELYGSDIMFIQSIKALREFYPRACINIIIPSKGPIQPLLTQYADRIIHGTIWVFRKSQMKTFSGIMDLLNLPAATIKAWRMMKNHDVVYINTVVVINFILAALLSKTIRVMHVHEIIQGIPGKIIGQLVQKAATSVICNSLATCRAFGLEKRSNTYIIWNGTECPIYAQPPTFQKDRPLRILMPGRINSWKGQTLLVKAVSHMEETAKKKLQIRIVGDVFKGQDHFRTNLIRQIQSLGLDSCINLLGFRRKMDELYHWADIVVVPSLRPEPFGLVAIEAMSHARPVIAASHGGLVEILADQKSGWLFPPGDAAGLAEIISSLLNNKKLISEKGAQAKMRAMNSFSNSGYRNKLQTLFDSLLKES